MILFPAWEEAASAKKTDNKNKVFLRRFLETKRGKKPFFSSVPNQRTSDLKRGKPATRSGRHKVVVVRSNRQSQAIRSFGAQKQQSLLRIPRRTFNQVEFGDSPPTRGKIAECRVAT